MLRSILCFLSLSLMVTCGPADQPSQTPAQTTPPPKDLVTFQLDQAVLTAAPSAQHQFNELLVLNTPRFQAKVAWSLVEGTQAKLLGPPDLGVSYLNMLFLALYEGETLTWSGAVALAPNRNAILSTVGGPILDVIDSDRQIALSFQNDQTTLAWQHPHDQDAMGWLTGDDQRLFYYYYHFPQSLVVQPKMPGGRVQPVPQTTTEPATQEEKNPR